MSPRINSAAREAARAARMVVGDTAALSSFRIESFGRHPDKGYFEAWVIHHDRRVYVHCRYGSWMVGAENNDLPFPRELLSPFRDVLAGRVREVERAERAEERKAE